MPARSNDKKYHILASILSADWTELGQEVEEVLLAGADMIHIDVMDNHYVPTLTLGPLFCKDLRRRLPSVCMDVHLMVSPVDDLIQQFAEYGANRISIHPDATIHLDRSLQLIQRLGCKAGLVINPATSIDCIPWCVHRLDFVLIMTVNPGFGGQTLISEVVPKIAELHRLYPQLTICVDGGVQAHNIRMLADAGATEFVAGSTIFHSKNYSETITAMRNELIL